MLSSAASSSSSATSGVAPRILLQSGDDGTLVELGADAAKLCDFVAGVLETAEPTSPAADGPAADSPAADSPAADGRAGTVVVPVPEIPGKHLPRVAKFLASVADSSATVAACAFLEECRLRGEVSRFILGLVDLKTPPSACWNERTAAKMVAHLDFIGADIPLVAAYAVWWQAREHPADGESGNSCSRLGRYETSSLVRKGEHVIESRFGRPCAVSSESSAMAIAVAPVLTTPLALAPLLLGRGGVEELIVGFGEASSVIVQNANFVRSLVAATEGIRRLCIELREPDTRRDWGEICPADLGNLGFDELVLAPVGRPGVCVADYVYDVIRASAWWVPRRPRRRLVVTTANICVARYSPCSECISALRGFVGSVVDGCAAVAEVGGGVDYVVDADSCVEGAPGVQVRRRFLGRWSQAEGGDPCREPRGPRGAEPPGSSHPHDSGDIVLYASHMVYREFPRREPRRGVLLPLADLREVFPAPP